MKKITKYDLAIIIILSIISESDFCSFLMKNKIGQILDIIIRCLFIIYAFIKIYKSDIGSLRFKKLEFKTLLILPIFIVCFSNYFVVLFEQKVPENPYIFSVIPTIKLLLTVICEELTFRAILFKEIIKYNKPIKSILISSIIFGLVHLANISSISTILPSLLQTLYSFGTGLILSFIYLYTDNFIFPFMFHLMFNLFNGTIIASIYNLEYSLPFFLINISIALIIGIYIILLLRREKYVTKNMDI